MWPGFDSIRVLFSLCHAHDVTISSFLIRIFVKLVNLNGNNLVNNYSTVAAANDNDDHSYM